MKQWWKTLKAGIWNMLFPTDYVCPVCGREAFLGDTGLCENCRGQLPHCGPMLAEPPLDSLSAVYVYDPILRPAMHRFKYKRETWLARFFMQDAVLPTKNPIDAIVPVPMHPLKAYRRGYNPPEALALALQQQLPKIPIRTDLIRKVKRTPSQTTLSAKERQCNVKDAFCASDKASGLSILLIDDVTTTGSTLYACAAALKAAGAAQVHALCACKARFGEETLTDEIETES